MSNEKQEAQRQKEIWEVLDRQAGIVGECVELIQKVQKRVQPVLRPKPESEGETKDAVQDRCKVAARIEAEAGRIEDISQILVDILDRLEV